VSFIELSYIVVLLAAAIAGGIGTGAAVGGPWGIAAGVAAGVCVFALPVYAISRIHEEKRRWYHPVLMIALLPIAVPAIAIFLAAVTITHIGCRIESLALRLLGVERDTGPVDEETREE
jgi:hypothetical protein